MPMQRMDRAQFFAKLAPLDDERLRKALWNLYWRGSAAIRQRIEAELDPAEQRKQQRAEVEAVDPSWTRSEVREFVELARAGAYLGGDRRVTPKERTRWRFAFNQLVKDAALALHDDDVADGAAAMEMIIDLAQEMRGYDYFRSEDPVEAARLVVSDQVALLWSRILDRLGFAELARSAAPQLVRWESRYGWTRTGFGRTAEKETSLAHVLQGLLTLPDRWVTFTDRYLEALDAALAGRAATSRRRSYLPDRSREERARNLAEWHLMLLDPLVGGEAEDRLDKVAGHPALAGPDVTYFRARLAHRRGDLATARGLATEALEELPGDPAFLQFAAQIDAPLPPRAAGIVRSQAAAPRPAGS